MAINYTEKGAGQHKAIADAGHSLYWYDGVWVASDETAVQEILDGYTLDKAKADRCAEVVLLATEHFEKAISAYSRGELARWPTLRDEAEAYVANPAASIPRITNEAAIRGVSVDALVAKVRSNASQFDGLGDRIAGTSGKHRDAINALTSFADVLAYDYSVGWPAV